MLAYRKCGGSTAFFFFGEGLDLEQVLAEVTENVEGRPHFFFGEGLDLEQVLDRGYRNCGGSTAFFFLVRVWTWNRCWPS